MPSQFHPSSLGEMMNSKKGGFEPITKTVMGSSLLMSGGEWGFAILQV